MIEIDIRDEATPMLQELAAGLRSPERVHRAIAAAALPVFQRRFRELAGTNRNPFGARGGFWNRMLAGTRATADAEAAIISMPREMALRYFGGTVTPKKAKFLAIPARTEAYGKSPRDFNDLNAVPTARGWMLVKRQTRVRRPGESRIDGNRSAGMVFYWLVRSATVAANPDVLPPEGEIRSAAISGVESYVARILARRDGGSPA